jgi:hypothetical protein
MIADGHDECQNGVEDEAAREERQSAGRDGRERHEGVAEVVNVGEH